MDPYRNAESDILDALEYANESYENWASHDPCLIEKRVLWTVDKILSYDDYSSWGEWEDGELKGLNESELRAELESFRGDRWTKAALQWLREKSIPAIVIVDSQYGIGLADGRGRVSLAVGLGLPRLDTIVLSDCPKKKR